MPELPIQSFGFSEIQATKRLRMRKFRNLRNLVDELPVTEVFSEIPKQGRIMDTTPTVLTRSDSLGPLVRQRRRAQQLRIDDAASLLGVSVDLMSRLENGQGSVRLDKALAILDGLGLALMVVPKEHPWARLAEPAIASDTGSLP
jgi:hypothetical protein